MLFNSHLFLFAFLPAAVTGYWMIQHAGYERVSLLWLLGCSLAFYGWWNASYLPLLLASLAVNFTASRILSSNPRPWLLAAALSFDVGLLAYFKYANFLLANAAAITGAPFVPHDILLPLAVSFFTIQQIVFLVDSFQGLCPNVSALRYSVYVTFFPHLIAGPIVLHNELIPQLSPARPRRFQGAIATEGLLLLSIGLLKKLAIADVLSGRAQAGFDGHGPLSFIAAWTASLSYTFQLYFDFSGYSDMAIGLALLFHLKLPVNFRSPYRSTGMIEFWQCWHITLSRFITSYLYTPMARCLSKVTFVRSMLITLAAMLIAGLWHGADWRFAAFGALHGLGLVVNHVWKRRKTPLPRPIAWAITFFWVNLTFVFFRAPSWASVRRMLSAMFRPGTPGSADGVALLFLAGAFAIVLLAPRTEELQRRLPLLGPKWASVSGLALAAALVALEFQNANEFLYFKF